MKSLQSLPMNKLERELQIYCQLFKEFVFIFNFYLKSW